MIRPLITRSLVLAFVLTSLGAARPENFAVKTSPASSTSPKATRTKRIKPYQVGRASWYGKFFHGKKTASGEAYDMFQFTAAHPVLPLGTLVKVTNLRNGVWIIVRVNDRGPVPKTRIIDLSYGAAQMLGLRNRGVEQVRLDLVNPDEVAVVHTGKQSSGSPSL
jgi:rare lipoprotein A